MVFNKSIGLDIGLTKIKAISLSRQNNNYVLDAFQVAPTPAKGMLSESPLDEGEMAQALGKTVDDLKVNSKSVNIALPDNQVYTKVIEMPPLTDKELSLAIYWEAERHIPVALSTITLVWNVLKRPSSPTNEEKMQVLMVGAPTNLINKYQKVLQMGGLNLNSIETETLAIVRALVTPNFPPTIIVSIGAINTSLAIIKDGILVLTYSIQTGGNAISRSIEADFGLTPSQGEEYKKTYGFTKEGAGKKIGKSTEPILSSILLEIRKALAFYSQKYKDGEIIQQVLLSGGTARLPGIDIFFAENLGIETVIANPWKIFANQQISPEILNGATDYTIALGLAMRDI
ncbi:MAG: type IV pilus assembly protein PilM [Candidatus Levybacteria bacterium]|nr:type IV pilus assembly protein PilM [Candidatus Levybacteria bacterium]